MIEDRDPSVKLLATGGQMFENQPGSVLGIYQPDRPNRHRLVETLVRLTKRASDLITADPKRAAIHIHKVLGAGITPLDVIERALVSPGSHFIADPSLIVEATRKMQDYQSKLGVIKTSVAVDEAFDVETFRSITP